MNRIVIELCGLSLLWTCDWCRAELEWVNKMAKGQQKKGKARLRRYEGSKQIIHKKKDTHTHTRNLTQTLYGHKVPSS